ncbi:hypothetical protein BM535_09805 [Clostridioides difficile]|nr:hypothetical protein BM535_09805 [Clostridioides difficile]
MRLNFLLDKDWLDLKEQSIIASNENSYVTFKCRDILQLLVTWLFSLFKNLEDLGELYKNRYYFIIVYYICSEYIFYTITIIKNIFCLNFDILCFIIYL